MLTAGYLVLAHKLQEAATAMSHEDIRTRLSDSLSDIFRGTGSWAYLVAVFGDDNSGDCIYSSDGDLKKAPYAMSKTSCTIDTAKSVNVLPLTTYEVESDSTEVTESGRRNSSRDQKQIQSIHDASMGLGAACTAKESAHAPKRGLQLVESAATTERIVLQEARSDYEIKLIAPGKGSSAFYPAEVLKRDGPKVFTAGTHVYLNHPTAAEESQRPEGDVKNLAGVLTTTALYSESHAKGPGLYARMKVFADHAQQVEEKAPFVGMSIRASGIADDSKREGVPVLKELTGAESVDVVTRAGAGGMILQESAAPAANQQEDSMDAAELKKLQESVAAADAVNSRLLKRAIRGDAREAAIRILKGVTLQEASKERVIESVLVDIPVKDGELDTAKFAEAVNAEAKREGQYVASITESGRVRGMGGAPVQIDVKEAEQRAANEKALRESAASAFEVFGLPKDAAKAAAFKGVAA